MEKFEGAEHLDNWVEDKKRLGLLEQQTKSIGAHVKPVLEILGPLQKHANEIGELSKLGQYGLSDLIPVVGIERFVDSLKGFLKLDEPLNVYKLICTIEPNKTKRKKLYDEVMGEWKKELAETEKKGRSESIDRNRQFARDGVTEEK
ncbi:hypothetical protein HY224_00385 [Candidatus Uhrbacteria bacterium]|nr:hypothetical protein [Candidatus Uhrbacteria bacterium]